MRSQTKTLKATAARTVELELPDEEGYPARFVVKRFHHPGRFQGGRDRTRAQNEYQILRALHERGLAVPRPIECFEADGAWVVRMELVAGAVPLDTLLAEGPRTGARSRLDWARLCRELGRGLARLLASGVVHPDLHPKNVLIDDEGRAFWIDFHGARQVRSLPQDELRRVLLQAAADLREFLPVRLLIRGFLSFREELTRALAEDFARAALTPAILAREGRALRRTKIAAGHGRWLRSSSLCRKVDLLPDAPFLVRRDLPGERVRRLAGPVAPAKDGRHHLVLAPKRELRKRWCHAGQLYEHGIAVLEPVLLTESKTPWAAFATPDEREIAPFAHWPREVGDCPLRLASSFGQLLGRLHDRGLEPAALSAKSFRTSGHRVFLVPPAELDEVDFAADAPPTVRFRALGGSLPWGETEAEDAFLEAYLAEIAGETERRTIRAAVSP